MPPILSPLLPLDGLPKSAFPRPNAGLVFARWFPGWVPSDFWPPEIDKRAIARFAADWRPDADALARIHARLDALCKEAGGRTLRVKTTSRLALGLGGDHPTENGFTFDPTWGQPILPGSSLKGLARAFARLAAQLRPDELASIFGEGVEGELADMPETAGGVVFLDAWPDPKDLRLVPDVLTPHEPGYYRALENSDTPPSPLGTDNPIPVYFLTIGAGATFNLRVLPRVEGAPVDLALGLMAAALEELGIGAKTAAGYGRFTPVERAAVSRLRAAAQGSGATETRDASAAEPAASTASEPSFVLPDGPWRLGVINATAAVDPAAARAALAGTNLAPPAQDRQLASAPMFDITAVGTGGVKWPEVATAIERFATRLRGERDRRGQARPTVFVGQAALPVLARLGARLGGSDINPHAYLHEAPIGSFAGLYRFNGEGAAPFFASPIVTPASATAGDPRPVMLFVSVRTTELELASLTTVAPEGLSGLVQLQPAESSSLRPEHMGSARRAVTEAARLVRDRFGTQVPLLVAINGPAPLAMLVGAAVQVHLHKEVRFLAFAGGHYFLAL